MSNLENYISTFYTIGNKPIDSTKSPVSKVVEEKINNLVLNETNHGYLKSWSQLISELSLSNKGTINNMSYLQYPNLKLSIVDKEIKFDKYLITKKTHLIISLLCPLYTFYHELCSSFVSAKGHVNIGSVIFLKENLFETEDSSIQDITKVITKYFEEHNFVYHLDIFNATFAGEPPWGVIDLDKNHFSAHDYLFDFSTDSKIFP